MTPYMFFKKNAGSSWDPKTETRAQGEMRCARQLARAERDARNVGIRFAWDRDLDGCNGCDCKSEECDCSTGASHETEYCFAFIVQEDTDARVVLASLGGICGASDDYRRVVEAELAQEALGNLDKRRAG